jgi:calpain-7
MVIPSTFQPGVECGFELRVAASGGVKCNLAPAPAEARGLERRIIRGEWGEGTVVGSPNHGAYWRNPQLRFTLAKKAELLIRLRVPGIDRHAAPPVNVALFAGGERLHEGTGRSLSRALAVSEGGVYAYPPGGACLPRAWFEPGSYVCVPSTFDPFVGPWELVVHATEGALRVEAFR